MMDMDVESLLVQSLVQYVSAALQRARLPFYRNYAGNPEDFFRGRLPGLYWFFCPETQITATFATKPDLENADIRVNQPPAFHTLCFDESPNAEPILMEVHRCAMYDLRHVEKVRPAPTNPRPVSGWIKGLGYEVGSGESYQIEGTLIRYLKNDPAVIRKPSVVRLACYMEWARSGRGGYLGAEILFGLVAEYFALDLEWISIPQKVMVELSRPASANPAQFLSLLQEATVLFFDTLGEAFGVQVGEEALARLLPPEALASGEDNQVLAVEDFFGEEQTI